SGDRRLFQAIDALVQAAPPLRRWSVSAEKPARGFGFVLDAEGVHLDPKALIFEPLSSAANPAALGIRVYVPSETTSARLREAVVRMVEIGLGEQGAAAIQHIEIAPAVQSRG